MPTDIIKLLKENEMVQAFLIAHNNVPVFIEFKAAEKNSVVIDLCCQMVHGIHGLHLLFCKQESPTCMNIW